MAKVFIMRGLPGAGKSTWVQRNYPDAHVCSADNFFIGEDGVYRFDGSMISDAHASCLRTFANTMACINTDSWDGPEIIVVDNTGIRAWEIAPYYNLAEAYGHDVTIVHICCNTDTAHSRNVHGVPLERVEIMNDSLKSEDLPRFWSVMIVENDG